MFKKLRREFIIITMAIAGVVLGIALGMSLYTTYSSEQETIYSSLERALEDSGPTTGNIGSGFEGLSEDLVAVIEINSTGVIITTTGASASSEMLAVVIPEVIDSEDNSGYNAEYHVAWERRVTESGYKLAIADTYTRDERMFNQIIVDILIFAVALVALYILVRQLADWVLKPVKEAWEQQRRFVSDASHELKTPLAVIIANTQILEDDPNVPDSARRWIDSTADESKHMKALVEDLLTLARADEREAEGEAGAITREDIDFSTLVSDCALEFDAVAFERHATIETNTEENIHVTGDRSQLQRVVRILLDNATKYAAPDSVIHVTLVRDGKKARLDVNNMGDVIAPEDLEHIFDRFYRTDTARERQSEGGFGLGLSIAKSLVEGHGGKISATSTEKDGTTFTVVL